MFKSDVEGAKALVQKYEQLKSEISKVIKGQNEIIHNTILSVFCQGHVLLVGVPGLAKTLLVSTIGRALGLSFNRIQFTPDLMPSDILGTEILDDSRQFKFVKGPVFSNIILADEINRTPPKTQAALLEAMQETGVRLGLDSEKARLYAEQTMLGAASLAMASEESLETLRVRVCSPGGSTIEGVKVFQNRELSETVFEALGASYKRTKELGAKK